MSINEKGYFGFKRTRGDASRVNDASRGVPALIVPTTDRDLHVASAADEATDWNVSNPTHPTVYVHSETTPATDYMALSHDATSGIINVASGSLVLQVDGTTVATVASTGVSFTSGNITVPDDALLGIGTGNTARFSWDTTDANANELLLQMPAGGGTDVPVLAIGQSIESVDLGLYNGVVDPRIALFGVGAVTTATGIDFRKARGTIAAPTVVTSGDDLGTIRAYGAVANGEYVQAAEIRFDMAGTIATTRGPGTITFLTATDAAPSVLTAALALSAAQNVTIGGGAASQSLTFDTSGTDVVLTASTAALAMGAITLNVTGTRLVQAYFTNHTTTNAETVDSSETVKEDIAPYRGDALSIVKGMDVITFRHQEWLDPSGETKLGLRAESVKEPLALREIERPEAGHTYPGVNTYGVDSLLVRAFQQLVAAISSAKSLNELKAALA